MNVVFLNRFNGCGVALYSPTVRNHVHFDISRHAGSNAWGSLAFPKSTTRTICRDPFMLKAALGGDTISPGADASAFAGPANTQSKPK